MIRFTLRLPEKLHEKIRWLSYKDRKSQQVIVVEILEKGLAEVEVPEDQK